MKSAKRPHDAFVLSPWATRPKLSATRPHGHIKGVLLSHGSESWIYANTPFTNSIYKTEFVLCQEFDIYFGQWLTPPGAVVALLYDSGAVYKMFWLTDLLTYSDMFLVTLVDNDVHFRTRIQYTFVCGVTQQHCPNYHVLNDMTSPSILLGPTSLAPAFWEPYRCMNCEFICQDHAESRVSAKATIANLVNLSTHTHCRGDR